MKFCHDVQWKLLDALRFFRNVTHKCNIPHIKLPKQKQDGKNNPSGAFSQKAKDRLILYDAMTL